MKKLINTKRKIARWFYVPICLSTAAFVFQACYGEPRDYGWDVLIEGRVKSSTTDEPIKGINVSVNKFSYHYGITDSDGYFQMYVPLDTIYKLRFEDFDSIRDENYFSKDTLLEEKDISRTIFIDIKLDEKQPLTVF
jgi:hypothetical protein